MKVIAEKIPGYTYGTAESVKSPTSIQDFQRLKQSVGFTDDDEQCLHLAGEVLADQTKALVEHWRKILSEIPHLARHSKGLDGNAIQKYSQNSGLRFQQWILDTCFRPYDQDWLDYQQEIALRHTSVKKNKTDGVQSTPSIPLRDVLVFWEFIDDIKPFLAGKGHSAEDVEKMHRAWCKSMRLQAALWAEPYTDPKLAPNQW
jgi:protoglobin